MPRAFMLIPPFSRHQAIFVFKCIFSSGLPCRNEYDQWPSDIRTTGVVDQFVSVLRRGSWELESQKGSCRGQHLGHSCGHFCSFTGSATKNQAVKTQWTLILRAQIRASELAFIIAKQARFIPRVEVSMLPWTFHGNLEYLTSPCRKIHSIKNTRMDMQSSQHSTWISMGLLLING